MHIKVETELFKKALETTSRISAKHLTLPVLQCVLLDAEDANLVVKATNLEIGVESKLPISTTEETGSVAVQAQALLQTVSLINQKFVILKLKGDVLIIETETSKTEIKSVPTDDFPSIPKIESSPQNINGVLFSNGIKTAAFTASQSSIKPELGSIYILQKKEHSLTFVATDSFRLMEKTVSQKNIILENSILIPYKNALEIAHIIHESDTVEFFVNENHCAFYVDGVYITSRLTNGTFPDYEQIIPKEYQTHTIVLTNDLSHALKKTNIFLNKFMQLTLDVQGEKTILSSQSGDVGTTTESISSVTEGADIKLNFNQRYISEALNYINDESTILHFAGIGRPMVLEGVHDKSIRYLVMPMNK